MYNLDEMERRFAQMLRSRHERRFADTEENASQPGWRTVKRDA